MTLSIRLNPAAKLDYVNAVLWYEEQREGLGDEFRSIAQQAFVKIQESPSTWPLIRDNFRSFSIPPFPYRIVYSVETDHIRVWAIFHSHRDPRVLEARLSQKPAP